MKDKVQLECCINVTSDTAQTQYKWPSVAALPAETHTRHIGESQRGWSGIAVVTWRVLVLRQDPITI